MPIVPNIPQQALQRAVIYATDVEKITGRRPRTARHLLQQIRKKLGKAKQQFITVEEFSDYTGIKEELVRGFLLD
jgi:hypothetical protein